MAIERDWLLELKRTDQLYSSVIKLFLRKGRSTDFAYKLKTNSTTNPQLYFVNILSATKKPYDTNLLPIALIYIFEYEGILFLLANKND